MCGDSQCPSCGSAQDTIEKKSPPFLNGLPDPEIPLDLAAQREYVTCFYTGLGFAAHGDIWHWWTAVPGSRTALDVTSCDARRSLTAEKVSIVRSRIDGVTFLWDAMGVHEKRLMEVSVAKSLYQLTFMSDFGYPITQPIDVLDESVAGEKRAIAEARRLYPNIAWVLRKRGQTGAPAIIMEFDPNPPKEEEEEMPKPKEQKQREALTRREGDARDDAKLVERGAKSYDKARLERALADVNNLRQKLGMPPVEVKGLA